MTIAAIRPWTAYCVDRRVRWVLLSVCLLLPLLVGGQSSAGVTLTVEAGGDLQAAIDTARPGETILLAAGVTYVGHFTLPPRTGSDLRPIVIRTGGPDAVPAGVRITPEQSPKLAKLRSPDGSAVLATRPGARFWTIQLIEFLPNRDGAGDIITLGDGGGAQTTLAAVPSDLVLDRLYVHGDGGGQKRGIALNSARTTISNCYIADIKAVGQDTQAIAGWNGPGDYVIENNYLEAAGENLLFGGADPSIRDLTPTGIVIDATRSPSRWPGSSPGRTGRSRICSS